MMIANARTGRDPVYRHHGSHDRRRNAIVVNRSSSIYTAMDLQHTLARSISHRTGGRVRLPQVQILGSRVILRGWATSYYAIQLALAGLLESLHAMGLDRPDEVELDIEVVSEETAREPIETGPRP